MSSFVVPANIGCAQQVRRTGGFDLDCDADTAFPFFSPEGERDWVSGWDPKPVFPDQIEFARDTVFRQGKGADEALWTIVGVDWQTHRAEYVRIAPASHGDHVVVEVEPTGSNRCHVVVSYVITVFGEDRPRLLDACSEAAYAARMRDWKQRISACLANR
jgi:hypothetical protein